MTDNSMQLMVLLYADDTIVMSTSKEGLQNRLDVWFVSEMETEDQQ